MKPVFIRAFTLSLLGLLTAMISGCTTIAELPETPPFEQTDQLTKHQQALKKIDRWQLKGRLALNYNGESWNASIHWQRFAERYAIQLHLPLGQGSMQLTGGTDGATLKTSNGEYFEAGSSEELFLQQFGLIFPVTSLQDWVIGKPAKSTDEPGDWLQRVDEQGRMLSLEQDQWGFTTSGLSVNSLSRHKQ